jgi:hypothetical protein
MRLLFEFICTPLGALRLFVVCRMQDGFGRMVLGSLISWSFLRPIRVNGARDCIPLISLELVHHPMLSGGLTPCFSSLHGRV